MTDPAQRLVMKRPLRVLIGGFGTRGDVQPVVALARALIARGHKVTTAVSPESMPKLNDLDAMPVGMNYHEVSRRTATGRFIDALRVVGFVRGEVAAQLAALESIAEHADVIVGSSVFCIGALLSAKWKRPFVYITFCPMLVPSGDHPSPGVPSQTLPRWLNRLSWLANRLAWAWLLGKVMNDLLRSRGLARVSDLWQTLLGDHPIIACEPTLATVPNDYRVPVQQVGAIFLDDPDELSAETEQFLRAGAPPVYVGFGSMSDPKPAQTTAKLISAVRAAGGRALVSRGWAALGGENCGDDVHFVGSEPHSKLFPRCSAIVHHGGSGTTHAAARAGVPQVIMPQILDQHYWAHRVQLAGIGLRVARYAPSPEPLTEALRTCTTEAMRARARAFAAAMQTDGVTQAAQRIESLGLASS